MKEKSSEFCQAIKDLESQVKKKTETIHIKDTACMNFKKKKEEVERHLN